MDLKAAIHKVVPGAHASIVDMIADHANVVFPHYGITTLRRQAAFLAHSAVETWNFTHLEENLNYTSTRLTQVWPKRFPTLDSARPYANNPQALANKVYGGRMGNSGSNDGWEFRGKGLMQCTGRYNHEKLGSQFGVPAETIAQWLVSPDHALECAAVLFKMLNVAPAADSGDVRLQTKRINGGSEGLAQRERYFRAFMRVLAAQAAPTAPGSVSDEAHDATTLDNVSADDLRSEGSRTIAGTDRVKQGLTGALTAAGSAAAVADQVQGFSSQVQNGVESVRSLGGLWQWVQDHSLILLLIVLVLITVYFVWNIYRGAQQAENARVDDARTGANIGR